MLPFKQSQYLELFFAGLIALSLTACSMPEPKNRNDDDGAKDNGTFFIEKAEVEKTGETSHEKISLPVSKTFNFRVCLKDSQHSKSIINHDFEIQIDERVEKAKSDAGGCIAWFEKIQYNHLADAKWVELNRAIRANGMQKGQRVTQFALNPWEDQGYSLIEKRFSNLQKGAEAVAALKGETTQGLWIDDLRLQVDEKRITKDGVVLHLEIRTIPSFPVKKTGEKRVLEPITNGEFEAELMLINSFRENSKDIRRPITAITKVKGKIVGGSLLLEQEVTLAESARYGQIQLALKVKALHAPQEIKAFSGVFNIAEHDQIKGSFFARLKNVFQEGSQTIDDYLTEKTNPADSSRDATKSANSGSPSNSYKSQVQVDPLKFRLIQFKNQNGLSREKVFEVTACMKAPIDLKALKNHAFKVQKANGQSETRTSNELGCISWQDSISYVLVETECWQSKNLRITNENLGMDQNLEIKVNPWSNEDASILDPRFTGKQDLLCAQGKSKIILTGYTFDKKQIDYDIDSQLNIKLKKEGIFKLTARLKRPSLTESTGFEDSALPPGKYRLRWAIVDMSVKDFAKASGRIFQVDEQEVSIDSAGMVSETLTFETGNLKAAGNINSLLFEIESLDQSESLSRATYRGTLILSNINEAGNLELVSEGIDSLVEKVKAQYLADLKKKKEEASQLTSKEFLARSENLYLVNLSNEKESENIRRSLQNPFWWQSTGTGSKNSPAVALEVLKTWLQTGKISPYLAQRFCGFWFQDHLQRSLENLQGKSILAKSGLGGTYFTHLCKQAVAKDPLNFFDVHYRYFMKNSTKVKNLAVEIKDVTFTNGFSLSQTHDVALTKTLSADINVGASTTKILEWLSPISASGGFRYAVAKSTADRTSNANTSNVSTGEALLLEKLSFQVRSQSYEKCAVIKLNLETLNQHPKTWGMAVDKTIPQKIINEQLGRGLLVCDGQATEKALNFTENYYVLNQKNFYTQAIDPNSDLGRPLFMAFRGIHDFRRVMKALGGKISTPQGAEIEQLIKQTQQSSFLPVFTLGNPAYPGQYLADE